MWDFFSHIATLGVVAWLWLRLEPKALSILSRFELQPGPELGEPQDNPSPRPSMQDVEDEETYESIPQELYQLAMQESESWAREQSLAAMIQLKQRLKSWDRVRAFYASKDLN